MDTLILYAYTFRSRAERVLWTLQELHLPHQVIRLDPLKGERLMPEFLKLNPAAKVPVLVHGDFVLTESLAIMEYLHDLVPNAHWIPNRHPALYQYRKMVHYGLTEIEPYLWIADQATHLRMVYQWPEGTADECIKRVTGAMPTVYEVLAHNAYIVGAEFTLADIYIGHLLPWARGYNVPFPPHVESYLKRLSERPACPEWMRNS